MRAWASSAGVVTGGRSRRGRWNSASQTTESIAVGTPARTWRGLRGWPSAIGAGAPAHGTPTTYPFLPTEGEGLHQIPVGPVHAGIIEPGHFRFQCHGEEVLHLEIELGYFGDNEVYHIEDLVHVTSSGAVNLTQRLPGRSLIASGY